MVAMPDMPDRLPEGQSEPEQNLCPMISSAMRFLGAVMILSSVGIWLVPVIAGDGAMVLMKLLVSVFFACVGSVLVQSGRAGVTDEIHMDTENRRLCHIQRQCDGIARTRAEFDFDDLADIRLRDGMLTVIGNSGATLVQLPVDKVENLSMIREMLGRTLAKTA